MQPYLVKSPLRPKSSSQRLDRRLDQSRFDSRKPARRLPHAAWAKRHGPCPRLIEMDVKVVDPMTFADCPA